MLSKRLVVLMGMLCCAGAALAHPGAPGHAHPEMGALAQVLHGVMSWAPLGVLAVVGAWGARKAQGSSN